MLQQTNIDFDKQPNLSMWKFLLDGKEKRNAYYGSPEWAEKKDLICARSKGICEECKSTPATRVHHITYLRLYDEKLGDLIHLCDKCNSKVHPEHNIIKSNESETLQLPTQAKKLTKENSEMLTKNDIQRANAIENLKRHRGLCFDWLKLYTKELLPDGSILPNATLKVDKLIVKKHGGNVSKTARIRKDCGIVGISKDEKSVTLIGFIGFCKDLQDLSEIDMDSKINSVIDELIGQNNVDTIQSMDRSDGVGILVPTSELNMRLKSTTAKNPPPLNQGLDLLANHYEKSGKSMDQWPIQVTEHWVLRQLI